MKFIFLPSTPPAAFSSSIASKVPLCDDCPNAASLPVSDANSPTLISLCPLPDLSQPVVVNTRSEIVIAPPRKGKRQLFINCTCSYFRLCFPSKVQNPVKSLRHRRKSRPRLQSPKAGPPAAARGKLFDLPRFCPTVR